LVPILGTEETPLITFGTTDHNEQKDWYCPLRKSTNALQLFLLCKYTCELILSQFWFVLTHTNTQKKQWNYPGMTMRLYVDSSDDIHKPMLGLIGLIIANQSSL